MIYFAQPVVGGPIKIGFSDNVAARLRQLEAHYGQPLAVLAVIEGDRDREREIHDQFSDLRFGRTEQFKPAPELLAFIGRPLLVSANPDAVEAMPTTDELLHAGMNLGAVRLDVDVLRKAKHIALYKGLTLAEYLSSIVEPIVDREMQSMAKEMMERPKGK